MDLIILLVKQLFYVSVISTLLVSAMPSEKYQKVIKTVCGMIMIMLLIQPLLKITDLENTFQAIYRSIIHNESLNELKMDANFQNENVSNEFIIQCQKEISENVSAIVMEQGLYPVQTNVIIGDDVSREDYGTIRTVNVLVSVNETSDKSQDKDEQIQVEPISVKINMSGNKVSSDDKTEAVTQKIASVYGIDEDMVSVQYKF